MKNENARTNRNNKRKEIDRFDWFVERIQTRVAFGWLSERSGIKTSCPKNFLEINRYFALTVILQHDWLTEQFLLHIRVFFGGKTRSPCFDLCIHWLIKQITSTYRHHFSRWYENRSIHSNNVFQYSKIRTRKRNAKKSIKKVKKLWIQPCLESGIHCSGIRNPVPGIRNPQRGIQNPRMSWIPLHGAIHRWRCFYA